MDELFTMKSDTVMNVAKKRNNTQIISTLRSETDSEKNEKNEKTRNVTQSNNETLNNTNHSSTIKTNTKYTTENTNLPILNMENKNKNVNINLEYLQEDIVNIAESLHNIVKIINEQQEKMNSIEKDLQKINKIETNLKTLNDVNNVLDSSKKDKILVSFTNENNTYESSSQLSDNTIITENINLIKNELKGGSKNNNEIKKNQNYNQNLISNLNNSRNTNQNDLRSNHVNNKLLINKKENNLNKHLKYNNTVSDSCQDYSCTYDNSKEVERKLNNVTKGINEELVNVKKVYAAFLSSYAKSLKK